MQTDQNKDQDNLKIAVSNLISDKLQSLKSLPPLKSTITIKDAGFDFWYDRVWILSDSVSDRYFYIGRYEYEIISQWDKGNIADVITAVNTETTLNIEASNVEVILKFLLANNLLQVGSEVMSSLQKSKNNYFVKFVQYASRLFYYKIPLVKPDNFLNKTKHLVKPIFSKTALYFIIILFFINVYLISKNWSEFNDSIPPFTDLSSILLILVTLIFTKIIHELGHAYACRLSCCKVPEMGVTLIFFYPLLYTDVSKSIVLDNKKRLLISTAGIRVEIYLAVIAGFFWFFVPNASMFKNILFFIAAISWLVSIAINIVPFIKFDGHYILSDYLNIRNLSTRSISVFKYYFRKYLIGLDSSLPENYTMKKYRFFLVFCILSGIYKVFLFAGILLFLYYIEILGVVLFIFGISMLLLMPLTKEIYNIWLLRKKMKSKKNLVVTCITTIIIIALLFVPIRHNIYMPAVLFAKSQRIYTPTESMVNNINTKLHAVVKKGDNLMTLSNLKLSSDKVINILNLKTEQYYSAGALLTEKTRQAMPSKQSDIEYQKAIAENLDLKSQQLEIIAPFDGKVTAIKDELYNNIWLEDKAWLLDIVDFNAYSLQAFITAEDINNIKIDNNHKIFFIPDSLDYDACIVKITSISREPITEIPKQPQIPLSLAESTVLNSNLLLFATYYGGYINLALDGKNNFVPIESFFTLDLVPASNCHYANQQILKGVVKVLGKNQSLATRFYNKVNKLFFRIS